MPGLPLLRIPHLVQLKILKDVKLFDLVSLSFCSEKARIVVESASVSLDSLTFRFLGSICFRIEVNENFSIYYSRELGAELTWTGFLGCCRSFMLFESTKHSHSVKKLTETLMLTFRVEAISVITEESTIQEIPVWAYTKSINTLVYQPTVRLMLSEKNARFILEKLTIKKRLEICAPVDDKIQLSEGFQQEEVYIECAEWVNFEAILNSKSKSITLTGVERPTTAQLNTLFKLWMSMEKMKNLKDLRLELETGDVFPARFFTKALVGIVTETRDATSFKIKRIDGTVACISHSLKFNGCAQLLFKAASSN